MLAAFTGSRSFRDVILKAGDVTNKLKPRKKRLFKLEQIFFLFFKNFNSRFPLKEIPKTVQLISAFKN